METNKVVTLDRPGGALSVREQPMPKPQRDNLLVRVELSGVCATDLHIYQGDIPGFRYPVTPGHEIVGTVAEAGEDFTSDVTGRAVHPGDRVVVMPATPDGTCPSCRRAGPVPDCDNFDVIGFSVPEERRAGGGWGQYVLCNSSRARVFVTEANPEAAVLAEPASTPVEGMRRGGVTFGDSVLVQGTGTIGLLAVAAAKALGAARVVAIGGPERRLRIAEELGADTTISIEGTPDPGERVELARAASPGGLGFDAVAECVGAPAVLPEGLSCLRKGGTYLELGHFSDVGEATINPYRHLLAKDARLVAVSGYTPESFHRALLMVERLGTAAESLVTHRLPMSRAREAVNALAPGRRYMLDGSEVGKIVIDPRL